MFRAPAPPDARPRVLVPLGDTNADSGPVLGINFVLDWELLLDKSESHPEMHLYISSTHTDDLPAIVKLDRASGSKTVTHTVALKPHLRGLPASVILEGINVNLDFQVRTVNDYNNPVPNPAGVVIIAGYEMSDLNSYRGVTKRVTFFQVYDEGKREKGSVTLKPLRPAGISSPTYMLTLDGVPITERDATRELSTRVKARSARVREILELYVQSTEMLMAGLTPTIPSVSNIRSEMWRNRAGDVPSVAFTLDVQEPKITREFYMQCARIARRRMRLTVGQLLALDIESPRARPEDIRQFASFAGNVLCAYVGHTTYRTDFVMAWNKVARVFEKILTENFGDMSVDEGSGDCEDGSKMNVRIYLGLLRLRDRGALNGDPLLQKLASFLDCFVPLIILLGVSSAQINAAPKDIKKMGAHENAILKELSQFVDALARFDGNATAWAATLASQDPRTAAALERSKRYSTIILESTGILEAVAAVETNIRARIVLEEGMNETVFYMARRTYYYREEEGQTSFLKTAEKMFSPRPLHAGSLFGSFVVTQERANLPRGIPLDRLPLRERYTKSASFARFIKKDEKVAIVMEPELNEEELICIYEVLKDVHPPEPLGAPGQFADRIPADKRLAAIATMERLVAPERAWVVMHEELSDDTTVDQEEPEDVISQGYYLRVGALQERPISEFLAYFGALRRSGLVREMHVYPEWVCDNVGGYRVQVYVDIVALNSKWKSREAHYARKLPRGISTADIACDLAARQACSP